MFTQLFGNFLINENAITSAQLLDALNVMKDTNVRLGVLAINAGYMTASQVERVHIMQAQKNMRIGDLAVAMGYLTQEQVSELLSMQTPRYLILGQALVNKEHLSNIEFEKYINAYKVKYQLSDNDFISSSSKKSYEIINDLFSENYSSKKDLLIAYTTLLINNLIRFVGEDFSILNPEQTIERLDNVYEASQGIIGTYLTDIHLVTDEATLISFACRYANEKLDDVSEIVSASANDFLNLHNGLFAVNLSNEWGIELRLTPPEFRSGTTCFNSNILAIIPISYPFGVIRFVITRN